MDNVRHPQRRKSRKYPPVNSTPPRPAAKGARIRGTVLSIGLILLLAGVWLGREAVASTYAQENPRLASLEIGIWPEFDRAGALVILHGEIAGDVTRPATVSLRIPASSGGPAALASATSANGELFNLTYERTDAQDFITLTFTAPDAFFQLEFYDPLRTDTTDRNYAYVWPGDLAVGQLSVRLQEPAGATDLSVQPELGAGVVGPYQFLYRHADLGPYDLGKALTIDIRYRKTDPRTSAQILGLATPTPPSAEVGTESDEGVPIWLLVLAVAAALVIGAGGVALWHWRGRPSPVPAGRTTRAQRPREQGGGQQENAAGFCAQCGNGLRLGDRFCPQCGTAVRERS